MEIKILGRKDLERVLEMPRVIEEVKSAYMLKAQDKTVVWPLVAHDFENGAIMDIRSGGVFGDINVHGLKMLNNFPMNADAGLPTFTGMLMAFDSTTGLPIGVMDASYITSMRTGAAGAIGAAVLARKDAENLLILGAGKQAIFQLASAKILMPQLKKISVADPLDPAHAAAFAKGCPERLEKDFGVDAGATIFEAADNLSKAVADSDIIITITPARSPVIKKEWVKAGTHFSCIGADMTGKEEIEAEIFRHAHIFADDKEQCARVGEMEIPIKTGVIGKEDVAGEIGQVLSGQIAGRKSDEEITIFDATGLALLDLVTAKAAIDLAREKQSGASVEI